MTYDALGRRVLKATRQNDEALCEQATGRCFTATARFLWAGERLVWEARAGGTPSDVGFPGNADQTGQLGYVHDGVSGGIDAPVLTFRTDGRTVFVHRNWRGLAELALDQNGQDCSGVGGV